MFCTIYYFFSLQKKNLFNCLPISVGACQVRMVTGDNLQTAKAIALECGILNSLSEATEPNIIEGRVFRAYSDKEREQIAKSITVCFDWRKKLE